MGISTSANRLADFIQPECVAVDLESRNKRDVLAELCSLLAKGCGLENAQSLLEAILKREEAGCTGIGSGVAVPHARSAAASKTYLAVGISKSGVPFDAPDDLPVRVFFLLLGPPDSSSLHLRLLSEIARLAKDPAIREKFVQAGTAEEILNLLK